MKWIGQHIWDQISRFRNDVYLEDISTGTIASGGNLGLDSNNKIVKATEATGDITSVALTAGTGVDITSVSGSTGGDYEANIAVDVSDFMSNGSASRILTSSGADAMKAETYLSFRNTGNVSTLTLLSDQDTADKCTISTTTHGATTVTTIDDGSAAAHFEIAADGDITLDAAGTIKLEGPTRSTGQIHVTHHSFTADIDTTKTYVSMGDADSEATSTTGIDMPLVFPVASKLLQVTLRSNKNLSALTYTWRLETQATGVGFATGPTIVGTQSGAGPAQVGHTTYDFTTSLDSGDNIVDAFDAVYLSIESSGTTANTKYYITCVWELDLSGY